MKKIFKGFLIQILILTAVLYVLWGVALFVLPPAWISPAIPVMIAFFMIITAGIYYFMLQSASNRFPKFVNSFMVVTLGKILLYAALIVIYALLNRSDAMAFIFAFFICYLVYTVFEVTAFLRDLKAMERP